MSVAENPVRIRTARPYDAAALLDLKRQLDEETAFMMYEPGERESSVQDLARELAGIARTPNSVVLLAEIDDQLAGYVELTGGSFRRSRATAYVVMVFRALPTPASLRPGAPPPACRAAPVQAPCASYLGRSFRMERVKESRL